MGVTFFFDLHEYNMSYININYCVINKCNSE